MENRKSVVALGMFDGVHIGHKKILDTAVLIAKSRGLVPTVYTFANHPQELFGKEVQRLCTNNQRCEYMKRLGIQYIDMVDFTDDIRVSSPADFIEMLIKRLNPQVIVAGFNYTFGKKKAGNIDLLISIANANGIDVAPVSAVSVGKQVVSSTKIRESLLGGDVPKAQIMLGRTYNLIGNVVKGMGRDCQMGFPTANLKPEHNLLIPTNGVYASYFQVKGSNYPSITYIGTDSTADMKNGKTIKTHILDFDDKVYDEQASVSFVKRLRNEKLFSSMQELKEQLCLDSKAISKFFGRN